MTREEIESLGWKINHTAVHTEWFRKGEFTLIISKDGASNILKDRGEWPGVLFDGFCETKEELQTIMRLLRI